MMIYFSSFLEGFIVNRNILVWSWHPGHRCPLQCCGAGRSRSRCKDVKAKTCFLLLFSLFLYEEEPEPVKKKYLEPEPVKSGPAPQHWSTECNPASVTDGVNTGKRYLELWVLHPGMILVNMFPPVGYQNHCLPHNHRVPVLFHSIHISTVSTVPVASENKT